MCKYVYVIFTYKMYVKLILKFKKINNFKEGKQQTNKNHNYLSKQNYSNKSI